MGLAPMPLPLAVARPESRRDSCVTTMWQESARLEAEAQRFADFYDQINYGPYTACLGGVGDLGFFQCDSQVVVGHTNSPAPICPGDLTCLA
eukprot:3195012-Amphidinium_carterae.1